MENDEWCGTMPCASKKGGCLKIRPDAEIDLGFARRGVPQRNQRQSQFDDAVEMLVKLQLRPEPDAGEAKRILLLRQRVLDAERARIDEGVEAPLVTSLLPIALRREQR